MKKIAVVLLFVFGLFSLAFAQSGRRITPAPAPTPAEVAEEEYSESKPNTNRRILPPVSRDNQKNKKSQKQPVQTPQTQTNAEADAAVEDDVLKIETNLVTIPVSVFDRDGLYIPNLRQQDFKIFENGKEQEIAYFGTSDKPFTVILLIDVSPSTAYKIEEIQNAALAFVEQLKPADNVMVIEFDASVDVLTEVTNDREKIRKAIRKADFGDGTSLYDAVDYSLRKRLSKIEGRKAIVLFTDGVDTTSYKADIDTTLRNAEESDSMIFPIYYNTYFDNRGGINIPGSVMSSRGTSSRDYALGRSYLEELAASTGGRVFRPESTPGGLTRAFEGIAEELRRQYNVGYYPSEEAQPGQRKQIRVRVNRPNLVIRARDSYIVGGNTQTAN